MNKIKIAVFTDWPDLVNDFYQCCEISLQDSVANLVRDYISHTPIVNELEQLAVHVHDRDLFKHFDLCLFINKPAYLDLHDVVNLLDSAHSTYIDNAQEILLYRPSDFWHTKLVHVPVYQEQRPERAGIIFIDCWQQIQDISQWPCAPAQFDFFNCMSKALTKYHAQNCVFHTGTFGNLPLAHELRWWHRRGNAVNIWDLGNFERHYKDREIFDWIVVGAHWRRCTHEKPLGFYNLLDLKHLDPNLRIYSHMDCTAKFVNDDIAAPQLATCSAQDYNTDNLKWRANGRLPELIGP